MPKEVRIEMLMMLSFGDRTRAHACVFFNKTHTERNVISKAIVTYTLKLYLNLETQNVKHCQLIAVTNVKIASIDSN